MRIIKEPSSVATGGLFLLRIVLKGDCCVKIKHKSITMEVLV
ncbi:hypothetical protein VPH209E381_0093 [Vibrio phage 209E38-1]